MYSIKTKLIAILLITTIAVGNFSCLGGSLIASYASNVSLENQNIVTNNENVEFDAYFMSEKKTHSISQNIAEKTTLFVDVNVKGTGYLKEVSVNLDANFKVDENYRQDGIQKIENNKIELNQINGNSDKTTITLPVYFDVTNTINVSKFNRQNNVTLKGRYIDDAGKSHEIEKSIVNEVKWSANPEATIEQSIVKYSPYEINENKGIIIEQRVKAQIKDNVLPIAESNMEMIVPEIQNVMPKISVRKQDDNTFSTDNWNYNENNKKLIIKESNLPTNNGEIAWKTSEEYVITYRYENIEKADELNFVNNISSNIRVYNAETKTLTNKFEEETKLTETFGQIIDVKANLVDSNMSKGYLYINTEKDYKTNYLVDISYKDLADEITLSTDKDNFVENETKQTANTYFKEVSISKENFKNVLGKDGQITILSNDKEIGKIVLSEDSEEQIKVNVENNINTILFKISKPQNEGTLNIETIKVIKENNKSKEQVESITALETSVNMLSTNNKEEVAKNSTFSQIAMVEPTSKIDVEISKTQFSTVVEKEEVEIKTILKTNSDYDSLYKNPTVDIILPKDVENIEVLGAELLYDEELKIENVKLINDTNKIIRIKLTGDQTKYNKDEAAAGATIVVRANVTLNNLTPTKSEKIKVLYTNQKTSLFENMAQDGTGIKELDIKFIAPTGLVPINTISNFAENKTVRSIAGSVEQGILEVSSEARVATSEIQLINNYNNKINNIRILGRALVKDVTNTSNTDTSIKNTIDVNMISAIVSEQLPQDSFKVYYSENGKATEDLTDTKNGWTLDVQDFTKIKSYLIVLENNEMNTGDSIKFNYQMQIPEGLNYNEKVDSVYTVYFDNVQEKQILKDSVMAVGVSLTTGEAPKLEANISSYSQENTRVTEGQYVKFKVNVKNTGTMDAENIRINATAPRGNIYYYIENGKINFTDDLAGREGKLAATYVTKHTQFIEDDYISEYQDSEDPNKTINIGSLKAGESKTVEYELNIDEVTINTKDLPMENGKLVVPTIEVKNKVEVISDKMPKAITSNDYRLMLVEGKMNVQISTDKSSDYILSKGSKLTYTAKIENKTEEDSLNNLEIAIKIPDGLKILNTSTKNRVVSLNDKNVDIKTNGNVVTFKVDKYAKQDSIDFIVETEVDNAQGIVAVIATAKADNIDEHISNVISNNVQTLNFSIEQQKLDKEYFKEGEEITYTYVVKNNSEVYADSFVFENKIPEGTKFKEAQIITAGGTEKITSIDEDRIVIERTHFNENEEITIKVTVIANNLSSKDEERKIENFAVIYGNLFEKIESNHITSIIEYNKKAHYTLSDKIDDDDSLEGVDGKYIVSGTAWIDSNKNGQRDNDEKTIEGLKVRLINSKNQQTVKDVDNGNEKVTTTSSNGKYSFGNLVKGKYIVVFEYDSSKYLLTQYQKDGVSKVENSDAISMQMNIDGTEKTVAMTDELSITDTNMRNIDVGMYLAPKSDLSLEKYVTKVTVTYGDTTKSYDFNNSKMAKVEVPGKNISNATVVVDYKIVVTNEGDIDNYVRKIVDYIPQNMKFNAELNKDWYQSSNGDLYNSSLANIALKPGESKEVTLTLTKKMTDSAEIVNNNAEIYEVYNKEGISDIDSTVANKVATEDDMSSADLVITIKTGEIIGVVGMISSLICITIAVVAYVGYGKMKRFTYNMRRG